ETIEKAKTRIEKIRKNTDKQIAVLTIKQVPKARTKDINLDDAGQRREMFEQWARERMKKLDLHGVHLLICQKPRHIAITVSADTEELFGPWYRNHLKGRMIGRFQPDNPDQGFLQAERNKLRSPDPDAGLLEAIDYLGQKFGHNRRVDQTNLID